MKIEINICDYCKEKKIEYSCITCKMDICKDCGCVFDLIGNNNSFSKKENNSIFRIINLKYKELAYPETDFSYSVRETVKEFINSFKNPKYIICVKCLKKIKNYLYKLNTEEKKGLILKIIELFNERIIAEEL